MPQTSSHFLRVVLNRPIAKLNNKQNRWRVIENRGGISTEQRLTGGMLHDVLIRRRLGRSVEIKIFRALALAFSEPFGLPRFVFLATLKADWSCSKTTKTTVVCLVRVHTSSGKPIFCHTLQ